MTFRNHGCEGDQSLPMQLWDTNNSDAMYLTSLVADGRPMTRTQLDRWAESDKNANLPSARFQIDVDSRAA